MLAKHDPKTQAERRRPLSASVAGRPPLVGSIQETPTKRVREVSNAMLGASLADFETLEQLGRGSFGVVSKVRDRRDGKVYVSKAIRVDQLKAHRQRETLAEVLNMRRVDHEHIVKLLAAFVEDGHLYIIMEYAEQGDLHHAIKRRAAAKQPYTEAELWPMFWQMCRGLQHLHDNRIIHRDIKPLNLFQTADGRIKIGDLGVSRVVQDERMLVKSRVGTPLFLAPELVAKRPYSFAVDVWSIGCVMYNLAALKTPFRGADVDQLGKSIVKDPVPPLPARFSAAFVRLVMHALEKDPAKRPSIRELVQMFPHGIPGVDTRKAAGLEAASPSRPPVVIGRARAVHEDEDEHAERAPVRQRPVSHYGRLQQVQQVQARVPKNTREVHVKQYRADKRPSSAAAERPVEAAVPARAVRPASARPAGRKPFLHVDTSPATVTSRMAMRRIHERPQSAGPARSPQGGVQPARRPTPLSSPTTRQKADTDKVQFVLLLHNLV